MKAKAKRKPEYENLTIPCRKGDPLSKQVKAAVKRIMVNQGIASISQALRFAVLRTDAAIKAEHENK